MCAGGEPLRLLRPAALQQLTAQPSHDPVLDSRVNCEAAPAMGREGKGSVHIGSQGRKVSRGDAGGAPGKAERQQELVMSMAGPAIDKTAPEPAPGDGRMDQENECGNSLPGPWHATTMVKTGDARPWALGAAQAAASTAAPTAATTRFQDSVRLVRVRAGLAQPPPPLNQGRLCHLAVGRGV
jgi:hypothetical protein